MAAIVFIMLALMEAEAVEVVLEQLVIMVQVEREVTAAQERLHLFLEYQPLMLVVEGVVAAALLILVALVALVAVVMEQEEQPLEGMELSILAAAVALVVGQVLRNRAAQAVQVLLF